MRFGLELRSVDMHIWHLTSVTEMHTKWIALCRIPHRDGGVCCDPYRDESTFGLDAIRVRLRALAWRLPGAIVERLRCFSLAGFWNTTLWGFE